MKISHTFRFICANPATCNVYLRRCFHSSSPLHALRKSKYPSIKLADPGIPQVATADYFKKYTDAEKQALTKQYTPEQITAIEAGEAAIDPNDLATQGTFRNDYGGLPYLDDFSYIHPVVDKPIRAPETNYDPNLRFKEEDEIGEDLIHWVKNLPEKPDRLDWMKFADNTRLTVGKEEAELNPPSYLSPELPELESLKPRESVLAKETLGDLRLQSTIQVTGYPLEQIRRLRHKYLVQHNVSNQTRLGKIHSLYVLAVVGNGRGLVGIGEATSSEPLDAKKMAHMAAIKHLSPVQRYEERTIFGDVKGKVSATEVKLMTRPPGFGLRCQALIYEICKCAGIQDLAARVDRSRNPMNVIKATIQALLNQRIPDEVARGLGRKLVDVRKVYYHGLT